EYDPETGRWTTRDPVGFGGADANLFAYVGNDPVNNVDVDGLISQAHMKLMSLCARHPRECTEVFAAAGLLAKGAQAVQQSAPNIPNATNLVCESRDTLQGLGQVGPSGNSAPLYLSRVADV